MTRSHLAACAGILAAGLVTLTAQQPPAPAPPATTQPPPASAPPATQQPPVVGPQPPATTPPQSQVFRGGVELVSLNVTVTDGASYVTDLKQDDFEVFEDGAKQADHVLQPRPAADRAGGPARHQREHGRAAADGAGSGGRLRQASEAGRRDGGHRLRQPGRTSSRPSPADQAALEKAIRETTANGSTSLYNAIYISLKELKKVKATIGRGDPPAGDRRAVGRRRHVEPGRVRRGARSREAIRDGDLRDRPALSRSGGRRDFKEAEFVLRQLSQETGGRVFFPTSVTELPEDLRADLRGAGEPVHASPTPRRTRSATAPGGASSSA